MLPHLSSSGVSSVSSPSVKSWPVFRSKGKRPITSRPRAEPRVKKAASELVAKSSKSTRPISCFVCGGPYFMWHSQVGPDCDCGHR